MSNTPYNKNLGQSVKIAGSNSLVSPAKSRGRNAKDDFSKSNIYD